MVDQSGEPPVDRRIAELAERQHGVVSLPQLRELGLGNAAVAKRASRGRLHRVHRGVYAVGHGLLGGRGRVMAAVLAYGPGAVASHRTAAELHGLLEDRRAVIDVSVPRAAAKSRRGIRAHAAAALGSEDVGRAAGIPCTGLERTLLDLAEGAPRRLLERALEQAQVLRVFDLGALEAALARADGHRGAAALRAVAGAQVEPALTASALEERFLELCRAAGLPPPAVNEWLTLDDGPPIRADFVWREQRLIVETDGWAAHGTREGFERDRLRDQRVRLAGWEPVRFTRRQVAGDPDRVAATTAALLSR